MDKSFSIIADIPFLEIGLLLIVSGTHIDSIMQRSMDPTKYGEGRTSFRPEDFPLKNELKMNWFAKNERPRSKIEIEIFYSPKWQIIL